MSHYLRILCHSEQPMTRKAIGEFIHEGYFFPVAPRFDPALNDPIAVHPDWERLEVRPPGNTHPIIFHRATHAVLASSLDEITQTLRDVGLESSHSALIRRIQSSRQLITVEVEPTHMTDDAWEMLDATEAHVARTCDGVVFVSGEGIYDSALQPLCTLKSV
ncbi:hypothetical protein [Melittangium boletus]|uniref:hypothetical protein n=1 Tax=Melittangium boletus TaxID=83453 RepID=UPI003DA23DB3